MASSLKIVLVDDDALVREVTASALRAEGYEVVEAADGARGLAALEKNPDTALLLTDVIMPGGLDGFSLAERARALHPKLRILYMSGYQNRDPMDGQLLRKPLRIDELIRAVAALLKKAEPDKTS